MLMTPPAEPSARIRSTAVARHMMMIALTLGGILLPANLPFVSTRVHTYLSSLPLAMAGIGYAILQFRVRPERTVLLKRLLLAGTFVAWAVDQLLPPGWVATLVGDLVITAYVLDLYWIIQEQAEAFHSDSD